MLFDKEKSNNEHLTNDENHNNEDTVGANTQTKSVINENKNNLLLEYDHEINHYKHYKHNNKKYKEKYTELSIKNHEDVTNAKEKLENDPLTYQTSTNHIKTDNEKLKQNFENESREASENAPDNKLDFVEYIEECSNEQQHTLSTDNRKNQKLLDV